MSDKPTPDSLLAIIRAHCLDCSGGSRWEVHNCRVTDCKLYPYRKGEARPKERKNKKNRQLTMFDLIQGLEESKNGQ